MVAALNRFISRCSDRCSPFFNTLRKSTGFVWNEECDKALLNLKAYLSSPPLISIPEAHETLYIYLATSEKSVSAALIRQEFEIQRPIYYISKTLIAAELNYLPLEKIVFALLIASRKLRHYFDAHPIVVYTSHPIKAALRRADMAGRMEKWSVELNRFHIDYKPRTAIKGQVLADFIAEFTEEVTPLPLDSFTRSEQNADQIMEVGACKKLELPSLLPNGKHDKWILFVDGSSTNHGSGVGIVLVTPDNTIIEQAVKLGFDATNNEAEYEALILGLKQAEQLKVSHLEIHCDSRLVTNQVTGEFATKNPRMEAYRNTAIDLMKGFKSAHIEQYPRAENSHADALATLASAITPEFRRTITVEYLQVRSIEQTAEQVCHLQADQGTCWMDPIIQFLKNDILPDDSAESHRVKAQASQYWVSESNTLYKRSFSGPYLRCVHPRLINDILTELHTGTCGSHTGGRSLAHRARSQGYWWPFMQKDAVAYTKKCDKCQKYSPIIRQPATELHPFTSPWPFAQWGLDIMGPFPRGTSSKRFLLVATDYFTKWVEAEALQTIGEANIRGFLWKNIITRFGVPRTLISDNGTQFKNRAISEFCQGHGITQHFSSVAYPQGNGQAEASNKIILEGLKKRLEATKGSWVEELPSVLWAYRTTPRRSTGETPFLLAYGTEAVIPLEVGLPTLRTDQFVAGGNDAALSDCLDQSQERRETALIRLAGYQQELIKQRRGLMKARDFQLGDLILRKVMGTTVKPSEGKLGQNWEGPYKITGSSSTGAYYLEDMEGNPIANPWNVFNLRAYYQ